MTNEVKLRVSLTEEDLLNLSKQDLIQKWKLQEEYVNDLEEKSNNKKLEFDKKLKDLEDCKNLEIVKLRNLLLMKYMIREQEQSVRENF
jgi:hypothetical protein